MEIYYNFVGYLDNQFIGKISKNNKQVNNNE